MKNWLNDKQNDICVKSDNCHLFTQSHIYIWYRPKISLKICRIHSRLLNKPLLHTALMLEDCGRNVVHIWVDPALKSYYCSTDHFRCFGSLDFPTLHFLSISLPHHSIPVGLFCKFMNMILNIFGMYSKFLIIKFRCFEGFDPLSVKIASICSISSLQPILNWSLSSKQVYILW
jgi:hypothetical protein